MNVDGKGVPSEPSKKIFDREWQELCLYIIEEGK
jgi:hypothetical protein